MLSKYNSPVVLIFFFIGIYSLKAKYGWKKAISYLLWPIFFILLFSSYHYGITDISEFYRFNLLRYLLPIALPVLIISSKGIAQTIKLISSRSIIREYSAVSFIVLIIFFFLILNLNVVTKTRSLYIDHEFHLMSADRIDDECIFLSPFSHLFYFLGQNSQGLPSTAYEIRNINSDCIYFTEGFFFWDKQYRDIANMIKESFNTSVIYSIENYEDLNYEGLIEYYNLTLYLIDK